MMQQAILNHPAVKALHLRSSVAEIEAAVRSTGLVPSYWYLKDNDFEDLILRDIRTPDQVRAVVKMLIADRWAMEGHKEYDCQKTWGILRALRKDSKRKEGFLWTGPQWQLSYHRRTHCCCHEVGSFALSDRCREGLAELDAKKKILRKKAVRG
jgi:hypothetical protein